MVCENKFCIYQLNKECSLKNPELDINGVCKKYICIKIDDETLEKLKKDSNDDLVYCAQEHSKKPRPKLYFD
jgi:hypothetical protein